MKFTISLIIVLFFSFSISAATQTAPSGQTRPAAASKMDGKEVARFTGTGEEITKPVKLNKGTVTFNMLHQWEKRDPELKPEGEKFSVALLDDQNKQIELIVGTIGHFDGSRSIEIPEAGSYSLKISGPGQWEVSIKQ